MHKMRGLKRKKLKSKKLNSKRFKTTKRLSKPAEEYAGQCKITITTSNGSTKCKVNKTPSPLLSNGNHNHHHNQVNESGMFVNMASKLSISSNQIAISDRISLNEK